MQGSLRKPTFEVQRMNSENAEIGASCDSHREQLQEVLPLLVQCKEALMAERHMNQELIGVQNQRAKEVRDAETQAFDANRERMLQERSSRL